MEQTYFAILTTAGEAKLANAAALGTRLELSTMAVGDGNGELPVPDPARAALVHELRRAPINTLSIDPVNANQIVVEQVIPEDVGGWWIREIGLFDSAGVLCAYANCPPTYKPRLAEGSGRTQVVRMMLIVSSTSAVELRVDPSIVLATRQYCDTFLDGVNNTLNKAVLNSPANRDALAGKPILVLGIGQSNELGANSGGPNPASPLVHAWDAIAGEWGSSDYTALPWTRPAPDGNLGCNNITLAFCHRLADETGRPVYMVMDARSGRPIADWVGEGKNSERYASAKAKIEAALASPELSSRGVTTVSAVMWMQGEEDYLLGFDEYLANLQTLVSQLRSEAWCQKVTPILMGEPSDLHDRYEPKKAIRWLGGGIDPWVASVNSKGLATSDQTHFTGPDLWEFGYHRFYRAYQSVPRSWHIPRSLFRNRDAVGTGMPGADPKYGDAVIYTESSIAASGADRSPNYRGTIAVGPGVSQGAPNGIAVGSNLTVTASGSGVFGVGSTVSDIDCLVGGYSHNVSGRYSIASGYSNVVSGQYAGAFGRGHTVADNYCFSFGGFTEYATPLADRAVFQFGSSNNMAAPENVLTMFASGRSVFLGDIEFKRDAVSNLGSADRRVNVVYASTPTISTSDARMKKVRGPLSDAEIQAWAPVSPIIYQLIESIDEKGEDRARYHAGLIAQDVAASFKAAGLDPSRYALFCVDEVFVEEFEVQTVPVQRQRTTPTVVSEIDIIDGKPVLVSREVPVPQFDTVGVVDENGNAVVDEQNGQPLMYRMPVMDTIEEQVRVPVQRSAGKRYGLRYTECLCFEAAYLRTLAAKQEALIAEITARLDRLDR